MKVFVVITVATQADGDLVNVRVEKAYMQASKADEYARNLVKNFKEIIQVPDFGPVEFDCRRGVHEIEVEE